MTLREFDALLKRYNAKQERQDFRPALICSVLANINRDPKAKSEPFTPKDFMLTKQKLKHQQTPEEMLAVVRIWNAALGGKEV